MIKNILREIKTQASPERAKTSAWFFKTGKGQYGAGDKFIGLTVPQMRAIAKRYKTISFADVSKLLQSPIHEHRFVALEILVMKYDEGSPSNQKTIVQYYLKHLKYVNNWDLVDTSAPYILGDYLRDKSKAVLYRLAHSPNLWNRRVGIVSTNGLIADNQLTDAIRISRILISDNEDLIQKAVGWMLREVGKKNKKLLIKFLDRHSRVMPRTMLRYSIEKFDAKTRRYYLQR